jgi:hypothetical protein
VDEQTYVQSVTDERVSGAWRHRQTGTAPHCCERGVVRRASLLRNSRLSLETPARECVAN